MIVSGPVGNPESSRVHKRSSKTINLSPNYKFLGLSLSTTSLVVMVVPSDPLSPDTKHVYNQSFFIYGETLTIYTTLTHCDATRRYTDDSILFSLQPNKKTKNAPKIANARPPVTSVKVRRVKSAKGNIREQHDLIVTIYLVSTTRPGSNEDKLKIRNLVHPLNCTT